MAYGTSLGATPPTVSVTAGPMYATQVNAYLEALRAVVEAKVTPGGMDISSNLSFISGVTNYSANNLFSTGYAIQTTPISATTYPGAIYLAGTNGDLYVNDAAGHQIRITASGGINTAAVAGITGAGYGTSGVAINWNSGKQGYELFAGAGVYGDVICDDVLLNDGGTHFLNIVAPTMGADYTMTLPAAVPATSNSVLAMSTAGVVTATDTPTLSTLTTTGAATIDGLLTATGGVTVGSGQNVTVSAGGLFKHGTRTMVIPGFAFRGGYFSSETTGATAHVGYQYPPSGGGGYYNAGIPLPVGARILSLTLMLTTDANAGSRTFVLNSTNLTTNAVISISSNSSTVVSSAVSVVLSPLTVVLASGLLYWMELQEPASAVDAIKAVVMTYDQP